jgi:hypothetical protein
MWETANEFLMTVTLSSRFSDYNKNKTILEMTKSQICRSTTTTALFCKSCFGWFQLVSAYSLSQNTIESAETSRLFHQPNQPNVKSEAHCRSKAAGSVWG